MRTKGRITDISKNIMSGKYRVTLEVDWLDDIESIQCDEIDITLKKFHKRRSLDQNAYAWVFIDKIASVIGIKKEAVYRKLVKDMSGTSTTICVKDVALDSLRNNWSNKGLGWMTEVYPSKLKGCTNVILYYGSSTFDKEQMSRFIDLIIQECDQLDIDTTPLREASLLGI